MFTGRDVVIISSIDWHELWQSHHEIATRLARNENRVLFVENLGIRTPGLRDVRRLSLRALNRVRSLRSGVRSIEPNLHVLSSLAFPPWGSTVRRFLNRHLFIPSLRRVASKHIDTSPIVWTFLPTDVALGLAESLIQRDGVLVYYAVADFEELAPDRESLRESESELVARADIVFANGEAIAARLRQWRSDVESLPVGVNVERFLGETLPLGPRDAHRVSTLARPIIGFIGGLHRHVDLELIRDAARLRPTWSWLLVGPVIESTTELEPLKNVLLFGRREHAELPAIVSQFDVGIIPYRVGPATRTVVPTKLNEYLACGKPVVSTRLPRCEEIAREMVDVIVADGNAEAFVGAIERALDRPTHDEAIAVRRGFARAHGWAVLLARMSASIANVERPRTA